ncbi:MAG: DNA polymerase III subunit alpha [Propionibacteriales bacterium]|nr:MAG: DNA polymerase III subunit alpha [Propionibacteriales bacterium]
MPSSFVHLHNHTDFSMLDGAARIPDLFARAEELGMPAVGMTDHGNVFGAYEFYAASKKSSVKPIIGIEAYLTPGTHRSERKKVQFGDGTGDDVAAKGAYTHMTIWSENQEGMHNLFRLSSRASLEGFFYKPRADRELLAEYSKGLIGTTGCPSGEVQTYLRLGQYDNALASAGEFRDIFGPENFYVELMDHGLDIERRVRQDLLRIASDLNAPLVATNDSHYVHAHDASAQDILLCINSNARVADQNRFKFDGTGYYIKSAEEMRALFADVPEACDNTLAIAERCTTVIEEGMGTYMPKCPVPDGETEESWFRHEVEVGLRRCYPGGITDEIRERADTEMEIIVSMGFAGYFLVVADFINWAKDHGIRVGPGRGSGAGSICGLMFERFLNPERISMPDFDIDFDDTRRAEVIQYVADKYGADRVSMIVTYGTIKAKQAIKDSARVLDRPFALGERITKLIPPPVTGKEMSIGDMFDAEHKRYGEAADFRQAYDSDTEVKNVVDTARGIEGLKRQWGVHAAGVIMSSEPLLDIIPIMKRESDGATITQFDYPSCESMGLVKMDFLGLRNLTVLDSAVRNIKLNCGEEVVLEELPLDDPKTFELLQHGETLGVFQLDGNQIRALLRSMQPDKFEDISAVGALYRPGPMGDDSHNKYARRKTGRETIVPIHPELAEPLEEILAETYGVIVYQEQVMAIARKLAGYSLGAADMLRRAMGKKKKKELDAQYETFSTGMLERGYSREAMQTIWDTLIPFSDYAFNKAHAAAYGLLSYWTAYLKANYPVEFMAALLQSVKGDKDKSAVYLAECRHMGIKVLPPCVNESDDAYTPVGKDIRFGLGAIRNVGTNVVAGIVEARKQHGPANDFIEFLDNVPLVVCNKRAIESMIKAGAFDSLGHTRKALVLSYEEALDQVTPLKRNEALGQDDLFGMAEDTDLGFERKIPDMPEYDKNAKLAAEREMLGLYVSDHPLNGLQTVLDMHRDMPIASIRTTEQEGATVNLAGLITQIQYKQTKDGRTWAIVTLEDLDDTVDVRVFPKVYEEVSPRLRTDTIVRIRTQVKGVGEEAQFTAREVHAPEISLSNDEPFVLRLQATRCTPKSIDTLKSVLMSHPGVSEVHLVLRDGEKETAFRLDSSFRVTTSAQLVADVKALFGPSCVGGR